MHPQRCGFQNDGMDKSEKNLRQPVLRTHLIILESDTLPSAIGVHIANVKLATDDSPVLDGRQLRSGAGHPEPDPHEIRPEGEDCGPVPFE